MRIREDWNEFWFGPKSAGPLGLYRIILGLLVLFWCVLIAPDLYTWYSERGVMPLAAMRTFDGAAYPWAIDLLAYVANTHILVAVFVLLVLAAWCMTAGFFTRTSTIIVWVLITSFEHRDEIILNSGDIFLRLMLFYMMFAPAGAACSVDRLIRIWRGKEAPGDPPLIVPWAQRLIQLQICIVYLSTFLGKVQGSFWQDGTAIYYPLHMAEMERFWVPFVGAGASIGTFGMYLLNILTYGALATEMSMATLVWVPRLRGYVLAAATLLHLGIEYALNIPLFSFLMISSYLNFVPNHWIAGWVRAISASFARKRLTLRYAPVGSLPTLIAVLARLDAFRLVAFEPMGRSKNRVGDPLIEVIDRHGKVETGFAGLRRAFWRMPGLWPKTLVFGYLPGVAKLGDQWLARLVQSEPRQPVVALQDAPATISS